MGWFAIACVIGFLAWSVWQLGVLPQLDTSAQVAKAGVVALIGLAIGLVVWATAIGEVATLAQFVDKIGEGTVARFLFGVALGFGVGHLIGGAAGGAPAQGGGGQPAPAAAETRPNQALLTSVGLTLLILALIAPHSDRWLRNLSGLKTSVIEVQLSRISTAAKQVVPDVRQVFIDQSVLEFVKDHDKSIEKDIQLLRLFVIENLKFAIAQDKTREPALKLEIDKANEQIKQMEDIHKVFVRLVSPLAGCVRGAIDRGLDIESARLQLRPLANMLVHIIGLEEEAAGSPTAREAVDAPLKEVRRGFRVLLAEMPREFAVYLAGPERETCADISRIALENLGPEYTGDEPLGLPPYTKYMRLPHLFSAMSYLLLFVNNDGLALNVMQKAQQHLEFEDLHMPRLRSAFMYYRGDDAARYLPLLENMRATALRHRQEIEALTARCTPSGCPDGVKTWGPPLLQRARLAEVLAMNNIVYGVAQDLAAGVASAEPFQPVAEDYAEKLAKAAEDAVFEDYRAAFLDTAAFITIVAEARRPSPDAARLGKAITTLRRLIAHQERRIATGAEPGRSGYATLKELRAHLASARGLTDE